MEPFHGEFIFNFTSVIVREGNDGFLCLKFEKQIDNGRGNVEWRMKNKECILLPSGWLLSPSGKLEGGLGIDWTTLGDCQKQICVLTEAFL